MTPQHSALIARHLSPLKRRHVLTWFFEQQDSLPEPAVEAEPLAVPEEAHLAEVSCEEAVCLTPTWRSAKSYSGRCYHHPAFIRSLAAVQPREIANSLQSLHSKIAFTLLNEFGPRVAKPPVYTTLIRQVANRFQ